MTENTYSQRPVFTPKDSPMKIVIFLSGSGTNMEAIFNIQVNLERMGAKEYGKIECVFTNAPGCEGAKKANAWHIPTVALSSKRFFDVLDIDPNNEEARDYYDASVISLIEAITEPDLIVLAGYRRKLGSKVMHRYRNRILNLYPGDITKSYLVRGVDAAVQALRAGEVSITPTVYFERYRERFGAALVQSKPISLEDFNESEESAMNEKIRREGEWIIYPYAVHELIAKGKVAVDDEGNIWVNGEKLSNKGYWIP